MRVGFIQDYATDNFLLGKPASDQVRKQNFRCVGCNQKFKRPPLRGICTVCGGKLIFNVSQGSVVKWLEPAKSIVSRYYVSVYLKQTIGLTRPIVEELYTRIIG